MIVLLGPGFHIHPSIIEHINRGESGLKLAEYDAIFHEAIVAAVVFESQLPVLNAPWARLNPPVKVAAVLLRPSGDEAR